MLQFRLNFQDFLFRRWEDEEEKKSLLVRYTLPKLIRAFSSSIRSCIIQKIYFTLKDCVYYLYYHSSLSWQYRVLWNWNLWIILMSFRWLYNWNFSKKENEENEENETFNWNTLTQCNVWMSVSVSFMPHYPLVYKIFLQKIK